MAVNILTPLALRGTCVTGASTGAASAVTGQVRGRLNPVHLSQPRRMSPSFVGADDQVSPRRYPAGPAGAECAAGRAGRPGSLHGLSVCRRPARAAFSAVLCKRGLPLNPTTGWRVGLVKAGTIRGSGVR